jgi:hypothetical protein
VRSFEHKNAWNTPRNKDNYDVLDNLISEISQTHFNEIKEKKFIVEEKEIRELSEEFMMSYSNSRVTNMKGNNMKNIDDISTFPTGSDIAGAHKQAHKQGRRVLKRIENTMESNNTDRGLNPEPRKFESVTNTLKPTAVAIKNNRVQFQNADD